MNFSTFSLLKENDFTFFKMTFYSKCSQVMMQVNNIIILFGCQFMQHQFKTVIKRMNFIDVRITV